MGISFDTVRSYWARIRQKIGGSTRAEIIATMVQREAWASLEASKTENQLLQEEIRHRKSIEQRLLESEARLQEAQEIAQVGNWEFNLETGQATVSPMVRRIFATEEDGPFTTTEMFEGFHPSDRDRLKEDIEWMVQTGSPRDGEYRIVLPDGSVRLVHIRRRAVVEEGKVVRLVGTIQDVTHYRSLEERTDQLTEIINTTPDLVLVVARNGNTLFMNSAARRFFGQPESGSTQSFNPFDHIANYSEDLANKVRETLNEEGSWVGEALLINYAQEVVSVSVRLVLHYSPDQEPSHLSVIVRDLSDHYRHDRAELEKAKFLESVVRGTLQAVITLDLHGTVTSMNPAAERMLEYSSKELAGKANWVSLHEAESLQELEKTLSELVGREIKVEQDLPEVICDLDQPVQFGWKCVTKSGVVFPVDLNISRLHDKNGQTVGYIGSMVDLRTHEESLEALMREKVLNRKILDLCPSPLYVFDFVKRQIIYANAACGTLLGGKLSRGVPLDLVDWPTYVYPDDLEIARDFIRRIQETTEGQSQVADIRMRLTNNQVMLIRCIGMPIDFGHDRKARKFIGYLQPIEIKEKASSTC